MLHRRSQRVDLGAQRLPTLGGLAPGKLRPERQNLRLHTDALGVGLGFGALGFNLLFHDIPFRIVW